MMPRNPAKEIGTSACLFHNWMNDGFTKIPGDRHALTYSMRYVTYSLHGLSINNDFVDQETSEIVRFWHSADS